RRQNGGRDAVTLFDLLKRLGIGKQHRLALLDQGGRGVPGGEDGETLPETLAAIVGRDRGLVGDPVQGYVDDLRRNAVPNRNLLERGQPFIEPVRAVPAIGGPRRHDAERRRRNREQQPHYIPSHFGAPIHRRRFGIPLT